MFNMKNDKVLKYKNYIGSVECDLTDKCLFGKILFIDDLITFEGNTIEELEKAFHDMVDDYLETCKEIGKEPQKAYSGTFNIRTTPEIHQTLVEIAKMENVSLNKLIVTIFNNFIEDSENKDNRLYNHILKNLSNA